MIYPSTQAAMLPQVHSHDYRVRVDAPALTRIVFDHLFTAQDAAVLDDCVPPIFPGQRAGSTEWQGQVGHIVVSLAWDWTEGPDGSLRVVRAVGPRSNLQLVDAQGYDMDGDAALWTHIESLAWRPQVAAAMAGIHAAH